MTMKLTAAACALASVLGLGAPALAAQLQPAKPVPANLYTGRWYEIARTPNQFERGADCEAPTADYGADRKGEIRVVQTCHRGSPTGEETTYHATGHILDPGVNTRLKLTYYLLISKEYWVLDYARDYQWAIVGDSSGKFVWLLSRAPNVAAATRSDMLQRVRALGYDLARLEFPPQPQPRAP
jgi:apolipoprotein D and lipocalin family protein